MPAPTIFLLADYPNGVEITRYLMERHECIVGLASPSPISEGLLNKGCAKNIQALLNLPKERVFYVEDLETESGQQKISALAPDMMISISWGRLIKREVLVLAKSAINLHLSYLPYNRGANPNVWSIIEGSPAGVTMHYIDEGADTGDIISQKEVAIASIDTGVTLYEKLVHASVELFKEVWPRVASGSAPRKMQVAPSTAHLRRDFQKLDGIDLDAPTTARKVINHLRAKTFPPFPGAYFLDENGQRVQMRIELSYMDDFDEKNKQEIPSAGSSK